MNEFPSITIRNVERDCSEMTAMLQEKGWVVFNGVVRSVAFSNFPLLNRFYNVDEGAGTLFSANEETQRYIVTSRSYGKKTHIGMPYVLLANRTMRFGLSQVAGGAIVGVLHYK